MKSIAFAILGLLMSSMVWAREVISGKVLTVIDGNTLEVTTTENEIYKILLFGIDSPELGQEFGEKAKRYLEKLILDKNVSVEIQGKDRLGNRLGIILIEGEDPRMQLLQEGLAWTAERQPIQEFETIKEKAREKGKGLWKEQEPTPPWVYRRQQTMTQFKSS
ncbi:MAG: thermonuclease family protein [Cyclobacteriaceae bacterium]